LARVTSWGCSECSDWEKQVIGNWHFSNLENSGIVKKDASRYMYRPKREYKNNKKRVRGKESKSCF
jgi:hypothetical protein